MSDGSYKIQIEVVGADKAARDLENVGKAGVRAGDDLERAGSKTANIARQFEQMASVAGRANGSLAGSFDRLASFSGYLNGIGNVAGSVGNSIGNMGTRTTQTMAQVSTSTAKATASFDALKKSMSFDAAASLARLEAEAKAASSRVGASSGFLLRPDGTRVEPNTAPPRSAKVQAAMDAAAAAQAAAAAAGAASGIGSVGKAAEEATGKVERLSAAAGGSGGRLGLLGAAARGAGGFISGLAASIATGAVLAMGNLADKVNRARSELEQFAKIGPNSGTVIKGLENSAAQAGGDLLTVAPAFQTLQDNYRKLGYSYDMLGKSAENNARFIELFSKALAAGGSTSEGVSKMLALIAKDSETGQLSIETLKAVMAENRTAAERMASSMGLSMEQFVSAVENGNVPLRTLQATMDKASASIEADFNAMTLKGRDLSQSFEMIGQGLAKIGGQIATVTGLRKLLSDVATDINAEGPSRGEQREAERQADLQRRMAEARAEQNVLYDATASYATMVGNNLVTAWNSVIAAIRNGTTATQEMQAASVAAAGSIAGAAIARSYNYGPGSFGASPERGAGNALYSYDRGPGSFAMSPELSGEIKAGDPNYSTPYYPIGKITTVPSEDGGTAVINVIRSGQKMSELAAQAQERAINNLGYYADKQLNVNQGGFSGIKQSTDGVKQSTDGVRRSMDSAARVFQMGMNGVEQAISEMGHIGDRGTKGGPVWVDDDLQRRLKQEGERLYGTGNYELYWQVSGRRGGGGSIMQDVRPTAEYLANRPEIEAAKLQAEMDRMKARQMEPIQTAMTQFQYGFTNKDQFIAAIKAAGADPSAPAYKSLLDAADKLANAAGDLNASSKHLSAIGASDLYGVGTPIAPTSLGDYWGGFRTNDLGSPTSQPIQVVVNVNGVSDFDSFQKSVTQVQDAMALALTTRVA